VTLEIPVGSHVIVRGKDGRVVLAEHVCDLGQ